MGSGCFLSIVPCQMVNSSVTAAHIAYPDRSDDRYSIQAVRCREEASIKRITLSLVCLCALALPAYGQNEPIKFIVDTFVVQASGTYETDPDLATLSFDISSQD
jgi:hypothetical protein